MKLELIITAKMAPKCNLHLTSSLCKMPGRSESEIACSPAYAVVGFCSILQPGYMISSLHCCVMNLCATLSKPILGTSAIPVSMMLL